MNFVKPLESRHLQNIFVTINIEPNHRANHPTEGNTITVNACADHNRRSIEQQTQVTLHFFISFDFYEEKKKKYKQEASKGTQKPQDQAKA